MRYLQTNDIDVMGGKPTKLIIPPLEMYKDFEFNYYKVIDEEDLHTIAKKQYGDEQLYYVILNANLDKVKDYFDVANGMILRIPIL